MPFELVYIIYVQNISKQLSFISSKANLTAGFFLQKDRISVLVPVLTTKVRRNFEMNKSVKQIPFDRCRPASRVVLHDAYVGSRKNLHVVFQAEYKPPMRAEDPILLVFHVTIVSFVHFSTSCVSNGSDLVHYVCKIITR